MTKHQKQIEMFRASAQSYRDEIDSGLYAGIPVAQMSAQAITWDEAADSLENMYLLDSEKHTPSDFERDVQDLITYRGIADNMSLYSALASLEIVKAQILGELKAQR